jgi:hypothetical protein
MQRHVAPAAEDQQFAEAEDEALAQALAALRALWP